LCRGIIICSGATAVKAKQQQQQGTAESRQVNLLGRMYDSQEKRRKEKKKEEEGWCIL